MPERSNPVLMFSVLSIAVPITFVRVNKKFWNWKELGINSVSIECFFTYTILIVFFAVGFVEIYPYKDLNLITWVTFIASAIFSFLQVALYQSYLMKVGKEIFKKDWINIFVNVILFTYMHLMFKELSLLDLSLIALAGLGFSVTYKFFPNFFMVGLFHLSTNLMALRLGMFNPHF